MLIKIAISYEDPPVSWNNKKAICQQALAYLDLSVCVVGAGFHEIQDKQLHRLTEMPAVQGGEV